MLRNDFKPYRRELVVSTKAGWDMWPGPNGDRGSRKYLLDSLDESLRRLGTDWVDIFYSHRPDPHTPVSETLGALDAAVRQGKARYAGISSYSAEDTREAVLAARSLGTPLVIHQPRYSMVTRGPEQGLFRVLAEERIGSIAFMPLAQGLLTRKFLSDSAAAHATERSSFNRGLLSDANLNRLRALNEVAAARGQSLAQLAISWVLRPGAATSALIGVSSMDQLDENLGALEHLGFSDEELAAIDEHAGAANSDVWTHEPK